MEVVAHGQLVGAAEDHLADSRSLEVGHTAMAAGHTEVGCTLKAADRSHLEAALHDIADQDIRRRYHHMTGAVVRAAHMMEEALACIRADRKAHGQRIAVAALSPSCHSARPTSSRTPWSIS